MADISDLIDKEPTKIIDETVRQGGYYASMYFDMHSSDPENLKNSLVGFIAKLKDQFGVRYVYGEIEEPIKADDLWSTSAEVKVLTTDFRSLARLCVAYAPIGIEILKPVRPNMTVTELQSVLLDVSATFAELNQAMIAKVLTDEEKKDFDKKMEHRAKIGKALMDRAAQ
ncbi:MAG TPA: hypothetical protein PLO51_05415, partial [Candidatus Micrarchaeota archaeon]|nr:hypothetical protein [Candidatus Micrarchaeota archaeon]